MSVDIRYALHHGKCFPNAIGDYVLHRTTVGGEGEGYVHRATITLYIIDQTERDYIKADLRVDHHPERVPGGSQLRISTVGHVCCRTERVQAALNAHGTLNVASQTRIEDAVTDVTSHVPVAGPPLP